MYNIIAYRIRKIKFKYLVKMPINRITIKSEGSSYMALNIPGTQIYAGRYHHGNIKTPDLFQEAGKTEPSKTSI